METTQALELIAPWVRGLNAYHLEPRELDVKLNQNENPFSWPDDLRERFAAFCRTAHLNRYPDFVPDSLRGAIADWAGVDSSQIIAGNGSNDILQILYLNLLAPARQVVLCQPTFTVYQLLARALNTVPVEIPLDAQLQFDMPALCAALRCYPTSLLVLCSPNNPTGSVLAQEQLHTILRQHHGFIVLDQAYVEFGGFNAAALTATHPNLVVTRTFSKALGGAGLRLGYLIAHPQVAAQLVKMKLPYNINRFTEFAGIELLRDRARIAGQIAFLVAERDRMATALAQSGVGTIYPSEANFILFRCRAKTALFEHLVHNSILVRDVSSAPLLEGCLRVNVGTGDENRRFLEAIGSFKQHTGDCRQQEACP